MSEEKQAFEGGATRTVQEERYDLVPFAAVRALARRLAMGAKKHGERNWEKGGVEFEKATLSHGIAHLLQYAQTGQQDDLDGALCNLAFLCHFREKATGSGEFTPTRNGILAGVSPAFFERGVGGPIDPRPVCHGRCQPEFHISPPLRPMPLRRADDLRVTEVADGAGK